MVFVTRSTLVVAASLISSLVASAAHAGTDANRSRGVTDLSWATRTPIVGPTSSKVGGSTLQVQVSADLDPVADPTKPMLSVDMKDVALEAVWDNAQTIQLVLVDSTSREGLFKIEHTLAPHITLFIDAFGFKLTYDYNAATLIQYVPGSNWNYLGTGSATFEPWGLKGYAIAKVNGPALANAQLFSIPLPNIGGSSPLLAGNLAFNATTSPTFNYQTTEVVLDGGDPLTSQKLAWVVPTTDADFLDVNAQVKGKITWSGNLFARPTVSITKIGSFVLPVPLTLDIAAAGIDMPYESGAAPIDVVFPATKFHIPLPNVKAAKTLDLGTSVIGVATTKPAKIDNTGELGATAALKSSDPQFTVAANKTFKPKEALDIDVTFTPTKEGAQTAEITVTSNDPNQPVQIIKVSGNGTKPAAVPVPPPSTEPTEPPAAEPTTFEPRDESGCGCRSASTRPRTTLLSVLGGLGVALAAIRRRRRA